MNPQTRTQAIERLLSRVASGMTTAADADWLRLELRHPAPAGTDIRKPQSRSGGRMALVHR